MLHKSIRRFSIHTRVAIIGGGCGGNTLSSQLINSRQFRPEEITVIDGNPMHDYQPGYTNIAGGVWKNPSLRRVRRDKSEMLNPDINWLQNHVSKVDPDNNKVVTKDGQVVEYEYLIVAPGIELRYDLIPGSLEALQDDSCPVGSMYNLEYAHKMSTLREKFKGGKAVFTLP